MDEFDNLKLDEIILNLKLISKICDWFFTLYWISILLMVSFRNKRFFSKESLSVSSIVSFTFFNQFTHPLELDIVESLLFKSEISSKSL